MKLLTNFIKSEKKGKFADIKCKMDLWEGRYRISISKKTITRFCDFGADMTVMPAFIFDEIYKTNNGIKAENRSSTEDWNCGLCLKRPTSIQRIQEGKNTNHYLHPRFRDTGTCLRLQVLYSELINDRSSPWETFLTAISIRFWQSSGDNLIQHQWQIYERSM